ncbi:MAG TPA: AAA family ATPase [Acidimicrobiales bacterium]|nr:AAA family ATPase [Acidimicrobiales bacterium]
MQRVSVVGNSGSGKTTLARQLAAAMDVPLLELDSIFHLPGWTDLPAEEFRDRVGAFVKGGRWVVDGNYSVVRLLVWARADTVVWVDPPHPVVMARVVRRTLRRVVTREELWNGNREPWSNVLSFDPGRSIVAWSWTQRHKYRDRYSSAMTDPDWAHIEFVPVRTRADRRRLLAAAQAAASGRPGQLDEQVP